MTTLKQIEERCTGHCCCAFWLPYSPEFLQENASVFQDGKMIADMVIPIYWVERKNRLTSEVPLYMYTCRHLQLNGDCAVYERRPRMCRDYPYDKPCPIDGCTMKPHKQICEERNNK